MLRSLEIQNFKGIKQGKLEDLAQVNVLVGRNNSGKSTILDALIMLRCAVAARDYFNNAGIDQIIKRRVDRGGGIDPSDLWFRLDSSNPLGFAAQYANGMSVTEEWSRSLQVRIKSNSGDHVFDRNSYSPRDVSNSGHWQIFSRAIGAAEATHLAFIHMLDSTGIHQPLAERLWSELIKDRRDVRVVQMLNEIYRTDIEYLSFMPFPDQTRLVAALPHAGIAVDWLGDGFRYAVNILALGMLLKGTALLVEELETHQHPESLRKLTQTLFELAKRQDLQLFLTTHSLELIDYALEAAQDKDISLKLYHMSLDQEGLLKATPFPQPDAKLLLDIGHDPRVHYKYIGTT
jgi:hypothetical protein